MTPTMDTSAATSAPTSFDSLMSSAFDQMDAQVSESTTSDSAAEATPTPTEAQPDTETATEQPSTESGETGSENADQAEGQQEQPNEFDEDDLTKPDGQEGKKFWYEERRAKQLLANHQAWRAVQDAVPGATVESIKEMYEVAGAARQMEADLEAGTPEALDRFSSFWSENYPEAFTQVMLEAPQRLMQQNPQAYQILEQRFDNGLVQRIYNTAKRTGDEDLFVLAQNLDLKLNGKFLRKADLKQAASNPLAEREAALSRREQEFHAQQRQQLEQRRAAYQQETDTAVNTGVSDLIEQALTSNKAIADAFKNKPNWQWMKRGLADAIDDAEKANPQWVKHFNANRSALLAKPSDEGRRQLVAMKQDFAKRVIARNLKQIVEAATGSVMSANAATHQKREAAQAKREPIPAGTPVAGVSVKDNPKVKNAKSFDELFGALGF